MKRRWIVVIAAGALALGCVAESGGTSGGGGTGDTGTDGTADTGTDGTADTGTEDTGDTGTDDTGTEGTGTEDTGTEDTGTEDTGTEDTDTEDTDTEDTGTGVDPCDACLDIQYCNPDGECQEIGTCILVQDCDDPGNSYPIGDCEGEVVCADGICGWLCDDTACLSDADCPATHWCSPTQDGPKACKPWKVEGEYCGGFTPEWAQSKCAPGLTCTDVPIFIADAPGTCRKPCAENSGCAEEQYCASDGYCRDDGTCWEDASHCNQTGNDWDAPLCEGTLTCTGGECGIDCSSGAECDPGPGECLDSSDCVDGPQPFASCYAPGQSIGCGMCQSIFDGGCADDAACKVDNATWICEPVSCACDPGSDKTCVAGCTMDSECEDWEICGADNRCTQKPCSATAECPANFTCVDGGCQRTQCVDSSDCDGCCVKNLCYDQLGFCSSPPP